jgi:hypothetical protein
MKRLSIMVAPAIAVLFLGTAVAHLAIPVGDDTYYVPTVIGGLDEGNPHVSSGDFDDVTIWHESNGHAGLQETATYDVDGNLLYGPDSQIL